MEAKEAKETVADIVAEWREIARDIRNNHSVVPERMEAEFAEAESLESNADRIEAAWKRQDEKICFVKRCLKMLDVELTRWSNGEKPVLSPTALLCPVLNAREALGEDVMAVPKIETTTGNAAAMREALIIAKKAICHKYEHICQSLSWENSNIQSNCADILCSHRELCEAKTAINAALSKPPRNCDVGTAEEQEKRFQDFCDDSQTDDDFCSMCARCSLKKERHCELAWAQMLYDETEKKGE